MLREIHHGGEGDFHARAGREPDGQSDSCPALEGGFRGLAGGEAALAVREQIRLVGGCPESGLEIHGDSGKVRHGDDHAIFRPPASHDDALDAVGLECRMHVIAGRPLASEGVVLLGPQFLLGEVHERGPRQDQGHRPLFGAGIGQLEQVHGGRHGHVGLVPRQLGRHGGPYDAHPVHFITGDHQGRGQGHRHRFVGQGVRIRLGLLPALVLLVASQVGEQAGGGPARLGDADHRRRGEAHPLAEADRPPGIEQVVHLAERRDAGGQGGRARHHSRRREVERGRQALRMHSHLSEEVNHLGLRAVQGMEFFRPQGTAVLRFHRRDPAGLALPRHAGDERHGGGRAEPDDDFGFGPPGQRGHGNEAAGQGNPVDEHGGIGPCAAFDADAAGHAPENARRRIARPGGGKAPDPRSIRRKRDGCPGCASQGPG